MEEIQAGFSARWLASAASVIDLACGFQDRRFSGTTASIVRVFLASASRSPIRSLAIDTGTLPLGLWMMFGFEPPCGRHVSQALLSACCQQAAALRESSPMHALTPSLGLMRIGPFSQQAART